MRLSDINKISVVLCLLLVVVLFFIFVSADISANYKIYNESTRVVSIFSPNNVLIANIQLITPIKYHVGIGYQKVAEFKITNTQDSSLLYNQMKFYNIKDSMKELNKTFDFKFKENTSVLVDDYGMINISLGKFKTTTTTYDYPLNYTNETKRNLINYINDLDIILCQKDSNTNELFGCDYILADKSVLIESYGIIGSYYEIQPVWKLFDKLKDKEKILAGEYTVGIFTNTTLGEYIEWIPTFYGFEINEWASYLVDGLIAYYKFDEASGTIAYDSLGISNLTNTGAVVNQTGIINKGYVCDGTDYIKGTVTGLPLGANSRSISFWVYPTIASDDYLMTYGAAATRQGFGVAYLGTTKFYIWVNADDTVGTNTYAINNWYHVVLTYNGTTSRLYVNGNIEGSKVQTLNTAAGEFHLCTYIEERDGLWGTLDEIGIWNIALNQSAINDLYNAGVGLSYPFEEGSSNCWTDESWGTYIPKGCIYSIAKGVVG